jgi:hypothetical protein
MFVRVVTMAGVLFFVVTGSWAFVDPSSFYDELATFPPYNRHFLHDIGSFELGLGAALALAALGWSGLRVALSGAAAANVLHAISHIVDSDRGGRSSDPYLLSLFAALFVAAAVLATREEAHPRPRA